jgi:PAS domain S-box-containing protein
MVKGTQDLLKENEHLNQQNDELHRKLYEANEIIDGIKKGKIDALVISNNEYAKLLVTETADQAYRKFVENMSEGVVTVYPDGTILYGNSSFAKSVNLPLNKVIGEDLRNFIPIEYVEAFEEFFNIPKNHSKLNLSFPDHAGGYIAFIVSLNIFHLRDYAVLNLVWTDVTDQKKSEENLKAINNKLNQAIEERNSSEKTVMLLNTELQRNIKILEEANIELGTFAHIASHDLQEPLRKIMTYSGILKNDYFGRIDPQGQSYLTKIQNGSARMRELINDILKYSEMSKTDMVFKPVDLQQIVEEIISDLEIVIRETKAIITIEKPLPTIEANAVQMRQLFQNIISNSLKFINADVEPKVNITYEIIDGHSIDEIEESRLNKKFYSFRLSDNGIGFLPEYSKKIFTIFQRLNNNSFFQGTGIGLAICKRIIERHHGFISAEGRPNEGAIFSIILPLCQDISPAPN